RDASSALVWFHYDLPWPLSDREYAAEHRWWTEPSGTIVLDVEGVDGERPHDGAVEVERVLTRIVMAPIDGGAASEVEYLFRADMAGMLPRAVRSQTAWKIPLNVMLSMRRSLEPRFAALRRIHAREILGWRGARPSGKARGGAAAIRLLGGEPRARAGGPHLGVSAVRSGGPRLAVG